MRIISRFHDYYDSVMRTGMDKEVVYVRDQKEIEVKKEDFNYLHSYHSTQATANLYFLGYCGSIYRIYEVVTNANRHIFHEYEKFKEFMLRNKFSSEWDFGKRSWYQGKYQKFRDQNEKPLMEFFHQYQVPLFLFSYVPGKPRTQRILLNPSLKYFEFYKVKDTHTAYQDIFQYVAGVLNRPENKMLEISNEDKIATHGFDKWSFRKAPKKDK